MTPLSGIPVYIYGIIGWICLKDIQNSCGNDITVANPYLWSADLILSQKIFFWAIGSHIGDALLVNPSYILYIYGYKLYVGQDQGGGNPIY